MTRSSSHKSHKQSKHSSKDAKDYISDTEEDLKVKERSYTKDEGRVSKESSYSASGEKRKLSSSFQSKEGKEGKDLSYSGNGDASEEYLSSKRRKEKRESILGGADRWTVAGDEKDDSGVMEKDMRGESLVNDSRKGLKSKESKGSSDLKNKSSRRYDSEAKKEEKTVTSVLTGKEENRSGSTRGDSKRMSEKDSSRREGRGSKETKEKEKERVSDRENKKLQENRQESELPLAVGSVPKKHDLIFKDSDKDRPSKRAKENSELGIVDEFGTSEVEKEGEKRIRKKREGSENIDVTSKGDRGKDVRYKSGKHGDKYHQDNKEKHDKPLGGDRDSKRKDEKYGDDDGERESKRREDKYRDRGDGKHRVDDNLSDDNDREKKRRDNKYSRRGSTYLEDGSRDDRHNNKDEKHREKNDKHNKEQKSREDFDREKRVREVRYRDDNYFRDNLSGDKSDHPRMLSIHDYDDRARLKDPQGRKRSSDKDDYNNDMRSRSFKDRKYDVEKRSTSDDMATDKGRLSSSRYADLEATSIRSKNQASPSSTSHQYRVSKQDELKYNREYDERVRHSVVTSNREYVGADKISSSRSSEKVIPKDDVLIGEQQSTTERRMKTDIRNSPRQLVDKSPSSATTDRRFFGRSDFRNDVDESGQRSAGFKEIKNYSGRGGEGRGTRELVSETRLGDEPSSRGGDTDGIISVSSPSVRTSHLLKSFSHPPPPPPSFRGGIDSPQPLRSGEDDGRMRSNNRYRRNGDPNNMVRHQGGPWKGLPNWASPVPNGFIPFQHGPPIGYHHGGMQQFSPAPPIMGLRPNNMELNHPFPMPDSDRFPLHSHHHMGWRTPVYDPYPPPPLHGRTLQQIGGRPWEPIGGESWKSLKPIVNIEPPHAFEKDINHELSNPSSECFFDIGGHSSDAVEDTKISAVLEESLDLAKMSEKDDAKLCRVYLSKLDISLELTDPELYNRYKDIVNVDDSNDDDHILYVAQHVAEGKEMNYSKMSLNPSVNDSLLQKAISLYKKRKDKFEILEDVSLNTNKPDLVNNEETLVEEDDSKGLLEECSSIPMESPENGSLDLSNLVLSGSKANELGSGSVNLNRILHSPESTH